MNDSKSFLLRVLLAVAVFTALILFFVKESEKREKLLIHHELDALKLSQKKLESDLVESRVSAESLKEKVRLQEETIAATARNLQEEEALRRTAEQTVAVKDIEIGELRKQIQKLEQDNDDLGSRMEKQYENYYQMKTQLEALLKTKEELEQKAKDLAENGPVSLGTVIVRQHSAG